MHIYTINPLSECTFGLSLKFDPGCVEGSGGSFSYFHHYSALLTKSFVSVSCANTRYFFYSTVGLDGQKL